MINELKY